MAQRIFIVSTQTDSLRPLSWQGIRAVSCYDQFIHILRNRLSPAHSALFAEPLLDSQAPSADWYAWLPDSRDMLPGQPIRLVDLPLREQETIRERMISLGRDIFNLARRMQDDPDSNSKAAGTLLEMGLTFPGEEHIYVIGGQPVLTAWGYTPGQCDALPETLTRVISQETATTTEPDTANPFFGLSASQASAQPPTSVAAIHKSNSLWIITAFLLGAILAGLPLYWFKPGLIDFGGGCVRKTSPTTNASVAGSTEAPQLRQEFLREQGREDILRPELDRLRQEYYLRLLECRPEEAAPPVPETAVPEESAPPVPQLAMPELPQDPPPAPPEPKPKPKPEPAPPPVPEPKSEHLEIPDNPTDLAFLEGCWEAEIAQDTPGRYSPTPQRLIYCFDADGNGRGVLSERGSGRNVCVGGAEGELHGDTLRIKDRPPLRPNTCITEIITCRNASSGIAQCSSVLENGDSSNLVFRRR